MPILKEEMLKGLDVLYPIEYTQQISDNIDKFLIPMNGIRSAYGIPMTVDSGWRSQKVNEECGGAASSKHLIGLAVDIQDLDCKLWTWVIDNLELMQKLEIYFEDKRWTAHWVHFQLGGPRSGHRIYIPNDKPAPAPSIWSGVYDHKFDSDLPVQP